MQRTALQATSFEHPCNSVIITRLSGLNMVATGQEMVWEKKFFKVRKFNFVSGKIDILKKSQGKLK